MSVAPIIAVMLVAALIFNHYRTEKAGLAATYNQAEQSLAAGDYESAVTLFTEAAGYRDADKRRDETSAALAPYRDAYFNGVAALDAGKYQEAIDDLSAVAKWSPSYKDVDALLAEAQARRNDELEREADLEVAKHEWLAADRDLSQLLANQPGDAALTAKLSELRRDHSPILFTRKSAIYMVGPDLADEHLIFDEFPAAAPSWSPDRSLIAFYAPSTNSLDATKLYVITPEGTGLRQVADRAVMDWWPTWSPDGTKIAFTSAGFTHGNSSVRVFDLTTNVETDLTSSDYAKASSGSWSPTGDRIAFVAQRTSRSSGLGNVHSSDSDVVIADVNTGKLSDVTKGTMPSAARVVWSPTDEMLLVWTAEGNSAWYEMPRTAILSLDPATGKSESLTPDTQSVGRPYWSPDGTRFAYVEGNAEQGYSVVRIRWIESRREAGVSAFPPVTEMLTWSTDGQAVIAMASDPGQGSTLIPLLDGPGTPVTLPIAFDLLPYYGPLQWSALNPAVAGAESAANGSTLPPPLGTPEPDST